MKRNGILVKTLIVVLVFVVVFLITGSAMAGETPFDATPHWGPIAPYVYMALVLTGILAPI